MTQSIITVGVLALQGAFIEHVNHLNQAVSSLAKKNPTDNRLQAISVIEVRTPQQLDQCQALLIPGGESTAISLVAERTGMLEPLRDYVKKYRRPVWGTCAGMILLAEQASKSSQAGQQLIGGLDVRVIRNHFGRQTDSFVAQLNLDFLDGDSPFDCVFIRAPVVDTIDMAKNKLQDTNVVYAPEKTADNLQFTSEPVKVLSTLPGHYSKDGIERVVALQQNNVLGTSFHPELTADIRVHEWWLSNFVFSS